MTLFSLGSWREARRISDILRAETVGGLLLLGATVLALTWANSPWGNFYQDFAALRVGPAEWHLNLSLTAWAADGIPDANPREDD
jgi:Na+:H+ antiporter, NhaA family